MKKKQTTYGTGRVFQRGTIWHLAWFEDGVEQRESTHQGDELVARARLREKMVAVRAGAKVLSNKELTVEALCARQILKFKVKKQNMEDALSNTNIWTRALGATTSLYKVAARIPTLIEEWQEAEEDESGRPLDDGYADATINRRLAFLQGGARLLKFTPLEDIYTDNKIPEDNVRDAYMNEGEFGRLYAAALAREPDLADYLEWLYLVGTRRTEAASLEARWVDTHRWVLTIPGAVQKHGKPRRIVLEGAHRRLIQQRLARVQPQVPWLFHRDGAKIGEIRRVWRSLCTETGFLQPNPKTGELEPRFKPHDLRRAASTNLLRHLNGDMKAAMAITGHLSISTFMRYLQVPEDQLRASVRSIPEPAWQQAASASSSRAA